jgi:hypothetical protein
MPPNPGGTGRVRKRVECPEHGPKEISIVVPAKEACESLAWPADCRESPA